MILNLFLLKVNSMTDKKKNNLAPPTTRSSHSKPLPEDSAFSTMTLGKDFIFFLSKHGNIYFVDGTNLEVHSGYSTVHPLYQRTF